MTTVFATIGLLIAAASAYGQLLPLRRATVARLRLLDLQQIAVSDEIAEGDRAAFQRIIELDAPLVAAREALASRRLHEGTPQRLLRRGVSVSLTLAFVLLVWIQVQVQRYGGSVDGTEAIIYLIVELFLVGLAGVGTLLLEVKWWRETHKQAHQ